MRKKNENGNNEFYKGADPEKEGDIYEESSRDELEEDDEVTPEEEGFMEGYEEGSKSSICPNCGKVIVEKEDVVEREVNGEHYMFCSERCADGYKKKKKRDK